MPPRTSGRRAPALVRTRRWRGPRRLGEFPTMGYAIGAWIQERCIVPSGMLAGRPYILTGEMWRHLVFSYRLKADATPDMGNGAYVYYGSQLRRVQKWGKDPFGAMTAIAQALAPVLFDGWDDDGEPTGRPVPTPWIQIIATSEGQTVNTWRPLYTCLHDGPLRETPGLDIGETRIKLPYGDGWIEPVTTTMESRLGAPITYATITEPHLMTASNEGLDTIRAVKRNLAGMDGRWIELTNAWDPSQRSVAQQTAESTRPGVYIDHRPQQPPLTADEIADDGALFARLRHVYGDSCRSAGGWVREERIAEDVRAEDTGDAERRRYFLDEVVVGSASAVDALAWDALARTDDPLRPGEKIALGFDGSRRRDATVLIACRLRDGRIFHLRSWAPPADKQSTADTPDTVDGSWAVPRHEVDQAVDDAFAAYDVWYLFGDPAGWQDYLARWAGKYPKKVVEFDTRQERIMDAAIDLLLTAYGLRELTHDGHPVLDEHARNAALAEGKRKPGIERVPGKPEFYRRLVKKAPRKLIDAFVGAVLAKAAAARAIEEGALATPTFEVGVAVAKSEDREFWRPKRLNVGGRLS